MPAVRSSLKRCVRRDARRSSQRGGDHSVGCRQRVPTHLVRRSEGHQLRQRRRLRSTTRLVQRQRAGQVAARVVQRLDGVGGWATVGFKKKAERELREYDNPAPRPTQRTAAQRGPLRRVLALRWLPRAGRAHRDNPTHGMGNWLAASRRCLWGWMGSLGVLGVAGPQAPT